MQLRERVSVRSYRSEREFGFGGGLAASGFSDENIVEKRADEQVPHDEHAVAETRSSAAAEDDGRADAARSREHHKCGG